MKRFRPRETRPRHRRMRSGRWRRGPRQGQSGASGQLRTVALRIAQEEACLVLNKDMRRIVDEQRLGYVASVGQDGTPNLSPKGTFAVWDDDHLVFAHLHSHHTVANLEAGRSMVEVNIVDPIARKGYR